MLTYYNMRGSICLPKKSIVSRLRGIEPLVGPARGDRLSGGGAKSYPGAEVHISHIHRIMSGNAWRSFSVLVLSPCRFMIT